MKIRRFQGSSTREVLAQIRQVLGPDAVILSNRSIDSEVEIVAAIDFDADAIDGNASHASMPSDRLLASPAPREGIADSPKESDPEKAAVQPLRQELQALRTLVENRWGRQPEPRSGGKFSPERLVKLGFSTSWLQEVEREFPHLDDRNAVRQALEKQVGSLANPLGDGGLFALLGPTGAGKTTSVAKLAAQQVLRYGPESVALFTSDTYRIAGVEQLGIYARILGVPVEVLRGPEDLLQALEKHHQRRWIFIDTMGLSPKDERLNEQLQWLDAVGPALQRFLLLPASLAGESLKQVLQPYEALPLTAAIVSKIDESPACGSLLEWMAAQHLPIAFLSDGQKVPENIHPLVWEQLLDLMGLEDARLAAVPSTRYHKAQ